MVCLRFDPGLSDGGRQAQGIHTILRSQTNPCGAYQSYAGVWGDGNYAYIGSERRNGVLIFTNPAALVRASHYAPSNSLDMEDISPTSVIAGATSTGTVTLATPASSTVAVTLTVTSRNFAVASIPASVTVPAGSSSATFPLVTGNVASKTMVQVSASLNGGSNTASLTVLANTPSSLKFSPTSVVGGTCSSGTVTLAAVAAADITVNLTVTSGNAAVASIPTSVTVSAGANSVGCGQRGHQDGVVNRDRERPEVADHHAESLSGGTTAIAPVTFSQVVLSDTVVFLAVPSVGSALSSLPATLTLPPSSASATVELPTQPMATATTVRVSAAANGGTLNLVFTVR